MGTTKKKVYKITPESFGYQDFYLMHFTVKELKRNSTREIRKKIKFPVDSRFVTIGAMNNYIHNYSKKA